MSFLSSLNIPGSALTAERFRMDIVAQNIANINTTRTAEGGPYRRKQVVLQERGLSFASTLSGAAYRIKQGGVRVSEIVESDKPFTPVYDPAHPDADANGYVLMPNVNNAEEQIDFMAASRAYEANITSLNVVKAMAMKALEIGR
jgi:flagellar basal-body rod protein FlgC